MSSSVNDELRQRGKRRNHDKGGISVMKRREQVVADLKKQIEETREELRVARIAAQEVALQEEAALPDDRVSKMQDRYSRHCSYDPPCRMEFRIPKNVWETKCALRIPPSALVGKVVGSTGKRAPSNSTRTHASKRSRWALPTHPSCLPIPLKLPQCWMRVGVVGSSALSRGCGGVCMFTHSLRITCDGGCQPPSVTCPWGHQPCSP